MGPWFVGQDGLTALDVALGEDLKKLLREVRVQGLNPNLCHQTQRDSAPDSTIASKPSAPLVCPLLEFLTSGVTRLSRLLSRGLLPGRLLPKRLLRSRFSWRKRWFPDSTFCFL